MNRPIKLKNLTITEKKVINEKSCDGLPPVKRGNKSHATGINNLNAIYQYGINSLSAIYQHRVINLKEK